MNIRIQHHQVGELQVFVVVFVHAVTPLAVGAVVLLHFVKPGGFIVDKTGFIAGRMGDGHQTGLFSVLDHPGLTVKAVIAELKEGALVVTAHIHIVGADVLANVFAGGVHGMLDTQARGMGLALPVYTAVVAVAVSAVVDVPVAIIIVHGVLLHHNAFALVYIQALKGQQQAEELVTARADGADFGNILIIGIHGHKAGNAALHLDFHQNIRLRKAALGAGSGNIVYHYARDALGDIAVRAGFAGEHIGLIGGLGSGGGGRRSRGLGCRAAVRSRLTAATDQHTGCHHAGKCCTRNTLNRHVLFLSSSQPTQEKLVFTYAGGFLFTLSHRALFYYSTCFRPRCKAESAIFYIPDTNLWQGAHRPSSCRVLRSMCIFSICAESTMAT